MPQKFIDLRKRHLLWIVVDAGGLRWDIDLDLTHPFQFTNGSLYRMLTTLARNVGGDKRRRFREAYPPLIYLNHLA
jgi:hypothetical protein